MRLCGMLQRRHPGVWDLDESMAIAAMKRGLRIYFPNKMLLQTFIELFERTQKYIQAKEDEKD